MPSVQINGISQHYDDVGSGETIVFLHGATGTAHSFEEYYPELSKRFRVIATDARGLGRSDHVKTMTPSDWVDDLKALMDHLSIDKPYIYGTSRGSRVAMRYAINFPDRVKAIMLQNIHVYLTPNLDERMNRNQGDGTRLPAAQQALHAERHGPDWLDVLLNYYNIRNIPGFQEYYDLHDMVQQIQCPILVIQSDEILGELGRDSFDQAFEIKNKIPDRVKLAVVPNFPGGPPLPRKTILSLVNDFVDSLAKVEAATAR
jgi:pimeloyl-ACP methyl ester carboxylesterase